MINSKDYEVSYILHLETATKNCSVSIGRSGKQIALKELNLGTYSHAEKLHVFIEEIMIESGLQFKDLDAVAIGKGPGSYTGLRIGVSAAKGICFALGIPLIAIETLRILAGAVTVTDGLIIPMLDARRLEVYSAVFDVNYKQLSATEALVIDKNSFSDYLDKGTVYFLGDGAEKCKEIIVHKNAVFVDGLFPSAAQMHELAFQKLKKGKTEDVAYFEPFYLKDFLGTKLKKRV